MRGVGIVGFGRIGRSTLRAMMRDGWVPKVIVDVADPVILAQLFKADTNYGVWPGRVSYSDGMFEIGKYRISYVNAKEVEMVDWAKHGVDVVIECSGRATERRGAQAHINAGAKYVLVGAPSKMAADCDTTILLGFNDYTFNPEKHKIVSMASCTTNGLAPLVKVLEDSFGIESGIFTTVHAYTNSQALVDQPMKDPRDSWAAAENIIPSSSGAAKALKYIWPDLVITGSAIRVPYRTGSIVTLNAVLKSVASVETINDAFRKAINDTHLSKYFEVLEQEWASARVLGETKTALIDLPLTQVSGQIVSVSSWYDNEAGYSARLSELAAKIAKESCSF